MIYPRNKSKMPYFKGKVYERALGILIYEDLMVMMMMMLKKMKQKKEEEEEEFG